MNGEEADMQRMTELKSRRWRYGDALREHARGLLRVIGGLSPIILLIAQQMSGLKSWRWRHEGRLRERLIALLGTTGKCGLSHVVAFFTLTLIAGTANSIEFIYVVENGKRHVRYEHIRSVPDCSSSVVTISANIDGQVQSLLGVLRNDGRIYYFDEPFTNGVHVGATNGKLMIDASSSGSGQIRMFYLLGCSSDGIQMIDSAYIGTASISIQFEKNRRTHNLLDEGDILMASPNSALPGFWVAKGDMHSMVVPQYKILIRATKQGFVPDLRPSVYRSLLLEEVKHRRKGFAHWVYKYFANEVSWVVAGEQLMRTCHEELGVQGDLDSCAYQVSEVRKIRSKAMSSSVIRHINTSLESISLYAE